MDSSLQENLKLLQNLQIKCQNYSLGQEEEQQTENLTPTKLEKQIDKAIGGWKTSSSQFNAVTGKIRTTGEFPHLISISFDIIFNCTQTNCLFQGW